MRVRMIGTISGSADGVDYPPVGEEVTVSDAHGADLCASGHAVPVVTSKEERAVASKPEVRKRKSE